MRILIMHRSFALVGGAERVITDKANFLANAGHQLLLVSYEQGLHPLPYELHPSVGYKDLDCRFFTLSYDSSLFPIALEMYVIVSIQNTYVWMAPENTSKYACSTAGHPYAILCKSP